ncbi:MULTISPECIES: CoA-transferase [unclassified Phyllobacterium]|uniref:CoA-transferase n=1 Tax=unclassified Phyllobacterium TaxID=2638441 RepID=UPI003012D918
MSKITDLDQALSVIRDGDTIGSVGVIGWLVPDRLLEGIAQNYHAGKGPGNLSFYFPVGVGDALEIKGMDHIAVPGLLKRVIGGNFINPLNPRTGRRSEMMRMIIDNEVEAYAWPIGASMHWLREVARKGPGYLTEVGIGSFIDPRQEGGKMNARTKEDLVHVRAFNGKEYLFYPPFPINVALLRASFADELGNLSLSNEPLQSASLALALAVKASGGKVIAQVGGIVPAGTTPATQMNIPAALVDHVVIAQGQMTTEIDHDARFLGGPFDPSSFSAPFASGADKVIARRAARELREDEVSIFGFGAATNIPLILAEEGLFADGGIHRYRHTTEHGVFGGIVMSGWQFSANLYPEALIDGPSQFDFIDGGGCEFAALSFAQLDAAGNINVSKFAGFSPGSGGFIDIATNAKRLVFVGTFTTAGLDVFVSNSGIQIRTEGKIKKFVKTVDQITYPLAQGILDRGQQATIVTERAVFKMNGTKLLLTEIAPGVDLDRDIRSQIDFEIDVADDLHPMDATLFHLGG